MSKKPFLIYILPAYNEQKIILNSIERIRQHFRHDKYFIIVVDNASTDDTYNIVMEIASKSSDILLLYTKNKGIGHALYLGINEAVNNFSTNKNAYIVLTGSDLPFGFTDIAILQNNNFKINYTNSIIIGSKYISGSKIKNRQNKYIRNIGGYVFSLIRIITLRINTKDTQGSIIFPLLFIQDILYKIKSRSYFFTTELIYFAEKKKKNIIEVPVQLEPESRLSKINLLLDGFSMLKDIFLFRFRTIFFLSDNLNG